MNVTHEENAVLIPLANNKGCAKVSPEDVEKIKKHKWHYEHGYAATWLGLPGANTLRMHRLILNPPKEADVDHINHDRLDNRRSNLRLTTTSQNTANSHRKASNQSSKYKGVSKKGNRWRAKIGKDEKVHNLGSYQTEELAARAYDSASLYLNGEYALLNFPDSIPVPVHELQNKVKPQVKNYVVTFSKTKGKWITRIKDRGYIEYVGSFKTKETAVYAGETAVKFYRNNKQKETVQRLEIEEKD